MVNYPGLVLFVAICISIILKSVQNHIHNKKQNKKKKIFSIKDLAVVILNVGFVLGGGISILNGLGYTNDRWFGPEITIAQPFINIVAGIIFVWFGLRFLFWEVFD